MPMLRSASRRPVCPCVWAEQRATCLVAGAVRALQAWVWDVKSISLWVDGMTITPCARQSARKECGGFCRPGFAWPSSFQKQ